MNNPYYDINDAGKCSITNNSERAKDLKQGSRMFNINFNKLYICCLGNKKLTKFHLKETHPTLTNFPACQTAA